MSTFDELALARLMVLVREAVDRQPVGVADQLHTALREGDTTLRIGVNSDGTPWIHAYVGGYYLCRVDIRRVLAEGVA